MNKPYGLNLTASEDYRFGSFDLTPKQRHVMATAMAVTNQMRKEGESALEDATRAVIILRGAGLLEVMADEPELGSQAEIDLYLDSYMDAVAELTARVPNADLSIPCTCQHGC
jgi:hypothetical protein